MKKKILVGSIIAVAVIVLSSFSSVVAKVSSDDELVEIDVEFCGLGRKHNVQLTQDEAEELKTLLDDIENTLLTVKSKDVLLEVLKNGFDELDKYGIFGNIGVKKTIELTTQTFKSEHQIRENPILFRNDDFENILCFLHGNLEGIFITITSGMLLLAIFIQELMALADILGFWRLGEFLFGLSINVMVYGTIKPINFMSVISNAPYSDGDATITSYGLKGKVITERLDLMLGFTGIKIIIIEDSINQYLFGTALAIINI